MRLQITRSYIPLAVLVLLAAVVRFAMLGSVPVSTYWDETAFGYNAYSLLQTGRDEYGVLFPVYLRSFDDYKLAGYAYLTIPFVGLLGLSAFSTRFASALLGTGTVLATYYLVKELLASMSIKKQITYARYIPAVSAFLLAISPWHIQFSRAGYEATAGLFFIVSGVWIFLYALRKPKFFIVSFVMCALSLYMYRAAAIVAPLIGMVLLIVFRKQIAWRSLIVAGFAGLLISMPVILNMFSDDALIRNNQVSIAHEYSDREFASAQKILENNNSIVSKIIYNRRFIYPTIIVESISSHLQYRYLVFDGDQFPRHGVRGMGILYQWELFFLLAGIVVLIIRRQWRLSIFLAAWLIIGMVPASLALPVPHALRSLYALPVPQIITAIGLVSLFSALSHKRYQIVYVSIITLMIGYFFMQYLNLYYGVNKDVTARDWGDGYPQLVSYIQQHEQDYDQVIISGHYWKPYIYLLFYTSYDPARFQASGSPWNFDHYTFGGTGWGENEFELHEMDMYTLISGKRVLIAFSPDEYAAYADDVTRLDSVYSRDGTEMFIMAELVYEPE